MIKENKYYTPELEEFHVGFEFTDQVNKEFNTVDFVSKEWELSMWNDLMRGSITVEKKSLLSSNTVHFVGVVKNKSELEKLLKQIGI